MTPLQSKLFEIILKIDEICQKHQIRYYLHAGSALGAVRHGGFIPWDDDMDVIMTHENWDKFKEAFEKDEDLHKKYALEYYPKTDFHHQGFACFKDKQSASFYISLIANKDRVKGCIVDMMLMDAMPADPKLQRQHRKNAIRFCELLCPLYVQNRTTDYWDYVFTHMAAKVFGRSRVLAYLNKELSKYPEESCYAYRQRVGEFPDGVMEKEFFQEPDYMEFEGKMLPCPTHARAFLRRCYGDTWMIMPPEEMRRTHPHQEIVNIPYTLIENDFKPFINYKKVNHAWEAQKTRKLKAVKYEDNIRITDSIRWADYIGVRLKRKLKSAKEQPELLLKEERFSEAEELFEEFFREQFSKRLLADKIPVPIAYDSYYAACILLIYRSEYYHAQELVDMHPEYASKSPDITELIDRSRELSVACYDERDWEKAYSISKEGLASHPFHVDYLAAYCWVAVNKKELPQEELLKEINKGLKYHPNHENLLFCKAEILNLQGASDKREELLTELYSKTNNGVLFNYIKKQLSCPRKIALPSSSNTALEQRRLQEKQSQNILLQLLEEIKGVCVEGGIPYFLAGHLLTEAVATGDFTEGNCSADIVLHPSSRKRFLDCLLGHLGPDRAVECFETNPDYPEFTIRYINTKTLMFNVLEGGFYQHNSICVKIHFIRRIETNESSQKFHDAIVAAMEATAYPSVFNNLTKEKLLAGTIAKTMMLVMGKKRAKSLLWSWVYQPENPDMVIKGSIKAYWYDRVRLPQIDFRERETCRFHGEDFSISRSYANAVSQKSIQKARSGERFGIQFKGGMIIDPEVSWEEFSHALPADLSNKQYAKSLAKRNEIKQKNAPYDQITIDAWNMVKRSVSRFRMAQKYMPMKGKIVQMYKKGDFDSLSRVLNDYINELRIAAKCKTAVVFDPEIFRITWALLEKRGETGLIKEIIPRIPARHLEPLIIPKAYLRKDKGNG